MWVEAILSEEDLVSLVLQLTPLKIKLSEDGELVVSDPTDITLVADKGLRVVCKAKVHWPVLGIAVPITLRTLTILLVPTIVKKEGVNKEVHENLVFKLEIEHADLAGVPTILDKRITERVNKELSAEGAALAWDFTSTLSHVFALPRSLEPLEGFELRVAWGQVKVTSVALVLAISFHSAVRRHTEDGGAAT